MAIDSKLLEYCKTDHQTLVITTIIEEGSNKKAGALLNIACRNIEVLRAKVTLNAAKQGYAPDLGINYPIPENLQLSGVSTHLDADGQIKSQWIKSKSAPERAAECIIKSIEDLEYKAPPKIKTPNNLDSDLLTLITLTDFHLGMYSWEKETGDAWNTDIAEQVLMNAINESIRKTPNSEMVILNLQGDFLHWDGLDAVTPQHRNILDADSRFGKMVELALNLTIWSIQSLLKKYKTVKLIVCEGNHDLAGSCWLRKSMKVMYKSEPRVEIDDTEFPYYAHLHGETMIAFHHGHKKKNKALPTVFASEPRYREMWGKSTYTYIHTGHYHHTEQDMSEEGGAIVERHPTLASADSYAVRGAFISRRGMRAITYHKIDGEIDRSTVLPRSDAP